MNLYNAISNLILEQASQSDVIDAIKNKHVCELEYEDDSSIGPGKRVVQPVAYGDSLRNNKVVRAYQLSGPSLKVNEEGIPLPDWRLFRVDRMRNFKPVKGDDSLFQTFNEPPLYNPFGDKSMNRMLVNSKF
jgi:predicted DNA-binding transcriptional regulator YafY